MPAHILLKTHAINGLKIKNISIGLGLTVESLSRELGVSRSYLTLIETGERRLPKRPAGKLAKLLSFPTKRFTTGISNRN